MLSSSLWNRRAFNGWMKPTSARHWRSCEALAAAIGARRGSRPVEIASEAIAGADLDWRQYSTYFSSRPDLAEVLRRRFAHAGWPKSIQTPIHIVHLSSAQALPLLRRCARTRRARHRGNLPRTICGSLPRKFPMEPLNTSARRPIRAAANREALWAALNEGLIQMVITDHSPCLPELKQRDVGRWDQAWAGLQVSASRCRCFGRACISAASRWNRLVNGWLRRRQNSPE